MRGFTLTENYFTSYLKEMKSKGYELQNKTILSSVEVT